MKSIKRRTFLNRSVAATAALGLSTLSSTPQTLAGQGGTESRRPNPIALTVVRLLGREGNVLRVGGVDMLNGTPVLDIKPYLSSIPTEEIRRGWLAEAEARRKK